MNGSPIVFLLFLPIWTRAAKRKAAGIIHLIVRASQVHSRSDRPGFEDRDCCYKPCCSRALVRPYVRESTGASTRPGSLGPTLERPAADGWRECCCCLLLTIDEGSRSILIAPAYLRMTLLRRRSVGRMIIPLNEKVALCRFFLTGRGFDLVDEPSPVPAGLGITH